MTSKTLSSHDLSILEKIKDPESAPSVPLLIDSSLPRDPHVTDRIEYERVAAAEGQIIKEFQSLEARIAACAVNNDDAQGQILAEYDRCISKLADLVAANPTYASAHNNHAQALRRKYGESILLETSNPLPSLANPASPPLDAETTPTTTTTTTTSTTAATTTSAATTVLSSLTTAIALLTPRTPFAPISPQAAKTLSQAHTQRGALFHITAKQMHADPQARLRLERNWTPLDLDEMAAVDFVLGGRYGNEIARGLAVAVNPTAKLCGSIVREALRNEFGGLAA